MKKTITFLTLLILSLPTILMAETSEDVLNKSNELITKINSEEKRICINRFIFNKLDD